MSAAEQGPLQVAHEEGAPRVAVTHVLPPDIRQRGLFDDGDDGDAGPSNCSGKSEHDATELDGESM